MKKCPYCIADIPSEARKCQFCGEWVDPPVPAGGADQPSVKLTVEPPTAGPKKPCPYCSALIPADAWACMYCKRGVLGGRPAAFGLTAAMVLFAAVFFFCFWLPGFLEVRDKQKQIQQRVGEFDRDWGKGR